MKEQGKADGKDAGCFRARPWGSDNVALFLFFSLNICRMRTITENAMFLSCSDFSAENACFMLGEG